MRLSPRYAIVELIGGLLAFAIVSVGIVGMWASLAGQDVLPAGGFGRDLRPGSVPAALGERLQRAVGNAATGREGGAPR